MIGFYAAGAMGESTGGFVPVYSDGIVFPFTYDDAEYNNLLTWTRGGGLLASPDGAMFDGASARIHAETGLPAWLTAGAAGPLTVQATVFPQEANGLHTGAKPILVVGNDAATPPAKLMLYARRDPDNASAVSVVARSREGSNDLDYPLFRRGWQFDFRFPESDTYDTRPQGVHFLDANTLLLTGYHAATNVNSCYKVEYPSGTVLGRFDFPAGLVGSNHINAIAEASDGGVWFSGNGTMYRVDLAASFASGVCVLEATTDIGGYTSFMAIAEIGGTEYMIGGQYQTTGSPVIALFPYSAVKDGGTFDDSYRFKSFVINQRTQGCRYYNGKLYLTMNRTTAESTGVGWIHECALDINAPDESALPAPDRVWPAPSQYPEDVDFHPTTGWLFTSTEGYSAVGNSPGWLAVWSMPLDGRAVPNTVTLEYDGAGTLAIRLNGKHFETLSVTPSVTPTGVYLGARPTSTVGNQQQWFGGTVKNLIIQQGPMTPDAYRTAVEGYYEPRKLLPTSVPLVNPGAEDGTTGWTAEVGSLGNRANNPTPHSGSFYFFGGPNLNTRARQRIDLLAATDFSAAELDSGDVLARVLWWTAGYLGDQDTSTMGFRFLDAAQSQVAISYGDKLRMGYVQGAWTLRQYAIDVPAGSRYLDVLIDGSRVGSGTNMDAYFDDIELVMYRRA